LPFGMMLDLLDRYECKVQIKGSTVQFCPKIIYITSPKQPCEWYSTDSNDKEDQLLRRITTCTEVRGTEVDGNTSTSTTELDSVTGLV
jgi:hypothetical protein